VRACLFDMDGLLLDTEDLYTLCVNLILQKYGKPSLPWSVKAKLQGRPGPAANKLFHEWAQLPISQSEYVAENTVLQRRIFPNTQPLPGVPELLSDLGRTRYWELASQPPSTDARPKTNGQVAVNGSGRAPPHRVHIALATSSHESNFKVKTTHLPELFSVFASHRRVLGDDPRIPTGRGKPLPDIYLVALKTINDSLAPGEPPVQPDECLVFEDSVPGVEAGRRAGMRVVWCPHPKLKEEYAGREREVLAARTGEAGEDVDPHQLGELDDGWAEYMVNLVNFPYSKFGIVVPDPLVEEEACMKETDGDVVTATPVAANGSA